MKVDTTVFCILVCIFSVLLSLSVLYKTYKTDNDNLKYHRIYKKILFSNLDKYLKSGDLLLFSSSNVDIKTRSWINSRFAHMGMVVKYNHKKYVIEMLNSDLMYPTQTIPKSNMTITPLFDRVANYAGSVYYSSLNTPLTKQQEDILISDYLSISNKYKYKYNKQSNIIYSLLTHSNKLDGNNRFCTEFIADIVNVLGIASEPVNATKFNIPNEMFKLTDGIIYTNPIHILCDNLMITSLDDSNYRTYCS